MRDGQKGAVLRQLATLCNLGRIGDASDGQLLERFATGHGEAAELAFAALVERHGALVLRVCRAVLRDEEDAQDAFQITFLVLVRKARSLWVRNSLGPWLHQVAFRAAGCTRATRLRRRVHERRAAEMTSVAVDERPDPEDFRRALHEEIARLPERYRAPVILCDLEGCTHELAARHLGCPVGTVKSRLARGRERLRSRLLRRGLAPTAGLIGAMVFSAKLARAAVPGDLADAMVQVATRFAAGKGAGAVSPSVAALVETVSANAFVTNATRVASAGLLTLAVVAAGTGVHAQKPRAEVPRIEGPRPEEPEPVRVIEPAATHLEGQGASSPQPFLTLTGHDKPVWTAAFSPDGKTLATGSWGELKLWDVATGRVTTGLRQVESFRWVAFSPDGTTVATAEHNGTAKLRDAASGAVLLTFHGHNSRGLDTVAFSPDGKVLATTSWDQTVKLWDVATAEELRTLRGHSREVYHVAFSSDGRTVASASKDQTAKLWSVETGKARLTLRGHAGCVHNIAFSPDGKTVATASWDQTIKLWDAATGEGLATLLGHTHQVLAVAFSPDGRSIVSTSGRWGVPDYGPGPGEIKVWDAASHEEVASLPAHTEQIFSAVFSPDGRTLATASFDRTVKLWDVSTLRNGR